VVPQAPSLLQSLRARGLKVAIVSNWHGGLNRIVSALGLADLVDFVVCSADVGFRKPHPEIFQVALRQSGVPASAVVHVGDTWDEDIVGAARVGITPVHLTNGAPPATDRGAHLAIRELSEITDFI
jgi:putative hydrolase of the HAD superfamily